MEKKDKRALFSAMLILFQLNFLVFSFSVGVAKETSIRSTLLPIVILQFVLLGLLFGILLIQYVVTAAAKKVGAVKDTWLMGGLGAMMLIFFAVGIIKLANANLIGNKELAISAVQAICLLSYVLLMGAFTARDDKKARAVQILCTVIMVLTLAMTAALGAIYQNDLLTVKRLVLLTVPLMLVMLLCIWGNHLVKRVTTFGVMIVEAAGLIWVYVKIRKSKEMLDVLDSLAVKWNEAQILKMMAAAFAILLAAAIVLQLMSQFFAAGKLVAIGSVWAVMVLYALLSNVETTSEGMLDVNTNETTTNTEYCLYVRNDDPAKTLAEAVKYPVGVTYEQGNDDVTRALAVLEQEAGTSVTVYETDSLIQLVEDLYAGKVSAIYIEGIYVDMLDEDPVFQEEGKHFSKDMRLVHTAEVAIAVDETYDPNEEYGGDELDGDTTPELSPEPTGEAEPSVSPEPTNAAGSDNKPTPTKKPSGGGSVNVNETGGGYIGNNPSSSVWTPSGSNKDLTKDSFTILLSGIDTYGKITTRSRSDVNVLMTVNPVTKEIVLVTTPRDAYVYIPGKAVSMRDKLTHAGNYGVAYSMATLEKLYGVKIDYFVRVNFTSVIQIVNAMGGVDVNALYDFTTDGGVTFKKGINHVNGAQALAFARERHHLASGDVTRGKHHMELVKAIFRKGTTSTILANYQSLLNTVSTNMQTNLTAGQIASLVGMQVSDGANWNFTTYATSGTGSMQYCSSYRSRKLWVSILSSSSVKKAASLMNSIK